ncbi:signal peptidase II [Acholeplasma sp. OttesenSCG-928-E16]|nr:signal peptidase II [Acholeplasma sp. OttesenSCG-928-E16]
MNKKRWISIIIIVGLLAIDQASKWIIYFSQSFPMHQRVPIILIGDKPIISFYKVINYGAGLSILEGQTWFFIMMAFIAVIALSILIYRFGNFKTHKVFTIGLAFLYAGALGNGIDRFTNGGGVIDFLEFTFLKDLPGIGFLFNWSCNFADGCLTAGVILVIIEFLFLDRIRKKKKHMEFEKQALLEKSQDQK